jgi:hypothetical protein
MFGSSGKRMIELSIADFERLDGFREDYQAAKRTGLLYRLRGGRNLSVGRGTAAKGKGTAGESAEDVLRRYMPKAIAEKIKALMPEGLELEQLTVTSDISVNVLGVGGGVSMAATFGKKVSE